MDNEGVGGEGPRRVDAGGESMITSLLVAIVLVNGEWREEGRRVETETMIRNYNGIDAAKERR